MPALMVQGVSSDVGKSLLVTAICRWLHRRGVRVAPFKAQNMSNNARVVDGGEIGTAQWLQARAAGARPDVRMNPVLLKPQGESSSQVVVNGVVDHELTRRPWRGRSSALWPGVVDAYRSLASEFDVVVIEGAGSPAETNLWDDDIVNMRVAELADAPVLLVADIDRGGAFAHLFGTWALLPERWRGRVDGFVLNKFRGDRALLAPAPADLERATGVPIVGVVPFVHHQLPNEEGPTILPRTGARSRLTVCITCGPYASNLDEFVMLQQVTDVRFVRTPVDLVGADLIVLPGSKNTAADLGWLRATGLATSVVEAARAGTPVLGVCGGLQMLGTSIDDPHGVEGAATGLGLLDVSTILAPTKRAVPSLITFGAMSPPWRWLEHRTVHGYEIRHGHTVAGDGVTSVGDDGLGFVDGNVAGICVHGVLEDPDVVEALCGSAPRSQDAVFDQLADLVEDHLDTTWLLERLSSPGMSL